MRLNVFIGTQTDRFYCHAEPEGEASGFSKRKTHIFSGQILRFTSFRSE